MSTVSQSCLLLATQLIITVSAELCANGHSCPSSQRCCADTCCLPDNYNRDRHHYQGFGFRWSIWNMWYFWFILIFILMSCFGGCGYWRRRQLLLAQHHQQMMGHYDNYHTSGNRGATLNGPHLTMPVFPANFDPSSFAGPGGVSAVHVRNIGDFNANPQAQQFFPSPPPYSEVMAKPDLWPPSKDELPPYPGEPVVSANQATALPQNAVRGEPFTADTSSVPGLPPYSSVNPATPEGAIMATATENTASFSTEASATASAAAPECTTTNTALDSTTIPPRSNSEENTNTNSQINAMSGQPAPQCVPDVHN